jgi:hypothetical protein
MQFFVVLAVICLIFTSAFAANCDSFASEKKCMVGSDSDGKKCSWCQSAAVGATCFTEDDAQSLPSSIYDCEYQKAYEAVTSCDQYTSEKSCMGGSVSSEKCSWCKSAAVGATCFKESDANSLPSSIYACEYQKLADLAVTSCDQYTSEKSCMGGSVGGEKCSWCKSAAVGATCFKNSDAHSLPSSIYECKYQKAYALRH